MIFPKPLEKGDKIAFLSPASAVKEDYVYGAMERFYNRGYEPVLMQYALGYETGSFSASRSERLMDLLEAIEIPEYKAIFCNRGGYGCAQLLSNISGSVVASNPKWVIGFSDVSALMAFWYKIGIASIHGPMAKHLSTRPENDPCSIALFEVLENGGNFDYTAEAHELNRPGEATGILRGGNLAVLNDLAGTFSDILRIGEEDKDGVILFLEDINEPIYKVNRMLWRLNLSGSLKKVKGLIFGQFTDYQPDSNYTSMETMIHEFLDTVKIGNVPVAFRFPTGHTDLNYPLVEGASVNLDINETRVRLKTV